VVGGAFIDVGLIPKDATSERQCRTGASHDTCRQLRTFCRCAAVKRRFLADIVVRGERRLGCWLLVRRGWFLVNRFGAGRRIGWFDLVLQHAQMSLELLPVFGFGRSLEVRPQGIGGLGVMMIVLVSSC